MDAERARAGGICQAVNSSFVLFLSIEKNFSIQNSLSMRVSLLALSNSRSLSSLTRHKPEIPPTKSGIQDLLLSLLNQCSNLKHIQQTHGFMISTGLDQDNLHLSKFIDVSSSLGFFNYAYSIFSHKSNPNIYLYNTMIKSLSNTDSPSDAIVIYNRIQSNGLKPDTYTFPFVLKAVVKLSAVDLGRAIHSRTIVTGLELDVHVVTALVQMYSSSKCISDARKLFDGMPDRDLPLWNAIVAGYVKVGDMGKARDLFERMDKRNVISYTCLIAGYAQMDSPNEAICIFQKMQLEDVKPDEITMLSALSACAQMGALELGEWIHRYINKHKLNKTVPLSNALIDMYAKSGNIKKALNVFDNMKNRSIITWTTMISGLALHGFGKEALEMFSRMEKSKIKPTDVTFLAILSACSHVGLVELGRWYFDTMKSRYGIKPKIEHYGCMIDLLARGGFLHEAQILLRKMPFEANAAIWGSLLAGSSIHGDVELGEHALKRLVKLEPHNSGNYALLSNIYASLGKWSESRMVRKVMRDMGVKKMPGGSYIELNNRVHEFIAGDISHPDFNNIYQILCKINGQLCNTKDLQIDICRMLEVGD